MLLMMMMEQRMQTATTITIILVVSFSMRATTLLKGPPFPAISMRYRTNGIFVVR